jgi:DNA-binding CsgD family transcriptional regulator
MGDGPGRSRQGATLVLSPEDTLELVGRQQELDLVTAALEDARAGRTRSLAFVGEPGIGKSSLLDAARRLGETRGVDVVRASGSPPEQELPYAGLLALLRPLREIATTLPGPQREALDAALDAGEEAGTRFVVGAATLGLLATAAERRPVLVLVDDVQWVDEPTLDALAFAFRRLDADAVALVVAARPAGLGRLDGVVGQVELAPLAPAAARAMLDGAAVRLDPGVRDRMLESARGNPLALLELPARLTASQREGVEPLPPVPLAGSGLEEAFAASARGLSEETRTALVVAALGETDELQGLGAALGSLGCDPDSLEPAETAGLVTLGRGRVAFRHPLVRSAVVSLADDAVRRRVHGAIAETLPVGERRALHRAESAIGPDEDVAGELEAAAKGLAAVTAAGLLTRAADLSADREARARRLGHAAEEALRASRLEQARELGRRAVEASEAGSLTHGRALSTLGRATRRDGPPSAAIRLLSEAADVLEAHDRRAALDALGDAFFASLPAGRPTDTALLSERLAALADERQPAEAALVALAEGVSLVQAGRGVEGERRLREALVTASSRGGAEPFVEIVSALWLEDHEPALRAAVTALEEARNAGDLEPVPMLLRLAGFSLARRGQLTAAYAATTEALQTAVEVGQMTNVCDSLAHCAYLEARLGLFDRCVDHARESIDLAARLGLRWFAIHATGQLALGELGRGRPDAAVELLEQLHARNREEGLVDPGEHYFAFLVEAYARIGRRDLARDRLAEERALVEAVPRPFDLALLERSAGLLAEEGWYVGHFERSIALHTEEMPFELARTRLLYGERLRRSGERRRAREELRRAEGMFEQLGATGWVERCRQELRASGARLRRGPEARDELTPQELQVALQVARGQTNREIAQTLFLSPKTVEFHLTRIYRKLGLNARAELVQRFADQV